MLTSENSQQSAFNERLQRLKGWFESPAGVSLLKAEQRCIDYTLRNIFGYYACQLSVTNDVHLLDNCQIGHHFKLALDNDNDPTPSKIICDPYFWPLEPGSLDLVLLHHVLEVAESPHRLLSEAAKSIIPDGKLMIIGCNPCSLGGISRWLIPDRFKAFKGARFIHLSRLRDWLTLLGFTIEKVTYGSYINPLEWVFKGMSGEFIEQRCDQWRLPFGCFYNILATREVHGVNLLRKPWPKVRNHLVGQPIARSSMTSRPR